jgi:hypothetical protein
MLRCAASFDHCGVLIVRLTPQDLRALPANFLQSLLNFYEFIINHFFRKATAFRTIVLAHSGVPDA